MEAVTVPSAGGESWSEELTAALKTQRARTREFLADQHARLRRAEEELTSQLQRLGEEMAGKRGENRQIQQDLDARSEVLQQQTAALERLKTELADRQSAWEKLQEQARTQWQSWQRQLARCEEDFERRHGQWEQMATAEQSELQRQLDQRRKRIEELESQLSHATAQLAAAETNTRAEDENYHRRYQMALDDLKELKAKNAELEQELAKKPAAPETNGSAEGGKVQDWETEKQRILAALEADFDAENEEGQKQRLKIEEVVRKTESLLADKNREIGELKHLLEDQSGNLGTVAVGAAALGEVLDQDALIREAREELKRLQEQLREKMRQAEVEVSIERAKLARQRQDLEERSRFLEKYAPPEPSTTPTSQKSTRGRWLERLGLKDAEK